MRIINSKYLIKISHKKRIFAVLTISSIGFTVIAVSNMATSSWGFYTALLGSSLCGSMAALGEAVNIGFLKVFPSETISGWASGTGMAGIFGSLLFIVLNSLDVPLSVVNY
jgi:hypothetical protein